MTNTTARTPGPWTACLDAYSEGWSTIGSNGGNDGIWVASLKGPDHLANTAFIVRAANSHDPAVEAMTKADEALQNLISLARPHFSDDVQALALRLAQEAQDAIRAALAKARQP